MNDGRCSDQLGVLTKRTAPASREAVVRVTTNTNPPLQTSIHRTLDGGSPWANVRTSLPRWGFYFTELAVLNGASPGDTGRSSADLHPGPKHGWRRPLVRGQGC